MGPCDTLTKQPDSPQKLSGAIRSDLSLSDHRLDAFEDRGCTALYLYGFQAFL